ncbi:integrase, partial [Paraburkholderia sediminicola]|uniref:integrase n=1 Tax=Paraburkholderia sediminicola TaxID=458836 RepID=UPI0038BA09AF
MVDVVTFIPQANLDARANLAAFVELCKTKLTVFGESLHFDDDRWDMSNYIELKARDTADLIFSNLETSGTRAPVSMRDPFKSFAKAYIRYQQAMRPTKIPGQRMRALRVLEAALLEVGTSDPVLADSNVLNRAAQLAKQWSANTAYQTGTRLEAIADFLYDNGLTIVPTRWRNPIRNPDRRNHVGKENDELRAKKLPSDAALDALPKVFRLATVPADILVSSVTAILCSAPDRVNEVLLLPVNCFIRRDVGKHSDGVCGLRWWPSKGSKPMIKWLIPSMSGIVEEAVEKVKSLTEDARKVATWYEENPGKLYLPENLEHLRLQELLSMPEINDILFTRTVHPTVARTWCVGNNVPLKKHGKPIYARFTDVESAILKMLPRGFPFANKEIGLKYSEALFVIQRNMLETFKTPIRCVIEGVSYNQIHIRLGTRSTVGMQSIFNRCGLDDETGNPIRLDSHQLRHYLNTLAQAGGMSQLDIAKWSGRNNVHQNSEYSHETSNAIISRIRTSIGNDTRMFGPLAMRRAAYITRDEFARLKVPTAHTTDFGYCIHDYVMSPCQMHRDCLSCDEQVCVKGELEKEKRTRDAHAEATRLLAMAEQAHADGELGASEWADHHRFQLIRTKTLLDILNDNAVPNGSVIRLTPASFPSRVAHATQAR